mgnify:FL=1
MKRHIAIGVTGASGSVYAARLFGKLKQMQDIDISVVVTENGELVYRYEMGDEAFESIPFKRYNNNDFFASFASGSSQTDTFIVAPCSMGALARIANGLASDLISRAADVMLKERRKLVLLTRETPVNLIHLENMTKVSKAGGIICPASPSFYSKPVNIEQAVDTVINRVIGLIGLPIDSYHWGK